MHRQPGSTRPSLWPREAQDAPPANDPSMARPAVEDSPEAGRLEPGSSSRKRPARSRLGPHELKREVREITTGRYSNDPRRGSASKEVRRKQGRSKEHKLTWPSVTPFSSAICAPEARGACETFDIRRPATLYGGF